MGLRTLVLAVVLLGLVAYVSSAPAPSDSSESKSHSASESIENSKSHSDESTDTSAERHDHHSRKHSHKREATSPVVAEHTTTLAERTTAVHQDPVTVAAHRDSTAAATSPKATEHGFEFYPLQAYFP
uniref:Secreted protein n=1 Tax=Lygus hesperus TaxID=30085 RepID=A0A0A9ZAM0_LYGHE